MVLADLADYWRAQCDVDRVWFDQGEWMRRVILNMAKMGYFSSDCAIDAYAREVWRVSTAG